MLEQYDANYSLYYRAKGMLTQNPVLHTKGIHKHAKAVEVRDFVGKAIFDNYFTFIFVRNPWDWQVSLYHFVKKDPTNQHHDLINSFNGFDEYIEWRCAEDARFQRDFVVDENGEQIVDFIGRKERLNEDFQHICAKIGIPGKQVPHLNQSVSTSYRDFYNDHTRNLVGDTFKADVDFFGYDF